jgi:hypothetical protein
LADVVIACISEDGSFVKTVFDYLFEKLRDHGNTDSKRWLDITSENVRLECNEILVSGRSNAPKALIKRVLESLLKSDPEKYKDYQVIEFGDSFTVGPVLPIDALTCEFCGYFTLFSEDLNTHRMTHLAVF